MSKAPRQNPSTMIELLRVLGMIAFADVAGAGIGLFLGLMHSLGAYRVAGVAPECLIGGVILGHLSSAIVVPLLWRKKLRIALPLVYGSVVVVGMIAALIIPPFGTVMATCLALIAASITAAARLPVVWDRPRRGACVACGYNLRGNESGRCPECGHDIVEKTAAKPNEAVP